MNSLHSYVQKMAEAHSFIHAVGFAVHKESSFFSMLDIYNYMRFKDKINETRSIFQNLLKPLEPLFQEYRNIAFYERNPYLRTFRMLMPVLIVTLIPCIVSVLVAPLALPEVTLTLLLIPAVFLGFVSATYYVTLKDQIYHAVRSRFYGGEFEIPEYQINQRMLHAFSNKDKALGVRIFYIDRLKQLSATRERLHRSEMQGTLSQDDLTRKEEITKKEHQLLLEWYDIHSNHDLSTEHARKVLSHRLEEEGGTSYKELTTYISQEKDHIIKTLSDVKARVQAITSDCNKVGDSPQPRREEQLIKPPNRYRLFSNGSQVGRVHRELEVIKALQDSMRAP